MEVDVAPLAALLASRPSLRMVLLNWSRGVSNALMAKLLAAGRVCFDIVTVEGVGGVANLFTRVPAEREEKGTCPTWRPGREHPKRCRVSGLRAIPRGAE
jgi:hypothetical protein